ncbi:MAG: serine/threonine protein kinase [Clostridiales bacterium]|nr:serine/threonine protein kinase [Clostridiales bacterium]
MEQQLICERYRPLAELGEGGYGSVVLAYDTRIQRRVAIKRLPFARIRGSSGEPVGLAEARTAALLNHPAIVTVHEWDTDADEAFIIMEHVDGATVADLLELSGGTLSFDEAAAILEAVADAVAFAHENGVLHLDLKPENVLVTTEGRVKVTDFGVAALSSAAGYGHGAGGTLGNMPIEQLRGEPVDERTDTWAFAVLAFELLTDVNPFSADTFEGAIFNAEIIEPPAPSEFAPELPRALDDIILAALATDPRDRYQDVRTLAGHLLRHLGDPVTGRRSLADLVAAALGDEAAASGERMPGVWDRLMPSLPLLSGGTAAVVAAWLAWTGLAPFELPIAPVLAAVALAALAAAVVPGAGLGVAIALLAAGLVRAGLVLPGAGVFIAGMVAWWTLGRRGAGLLPMFAGPPLAAVWLGPSAPLITGFTTRPVRAAILGSLTAALTLVASTLSGADVPYADVRWHFFVDPWGAFAHPDTGARLAELISTPAPLAVIAAWGLAAAIMSLGCARASRSGAVLGGTLGVATLAAGHSAAQLITTVVNGSVTWSDELLPVRLAASSILMMLLIAAGPPVRGEEQAP